MTRDEARAALIEVLATELFEIGNRRIGRREWIDVSDHYRDEAAEVLDVLLAHPLLAVALDG